MRTAAPGRAAGTQKDDRGSSDSRRSALRQEPPLTEQFDTLLAGLYPGALRTLLDPLKTVPLKIGIHAEIADALGLDLAERKQLGRLLRRWCGRAAYLKALRTGAPRFGLDGQPAGEVSAEHAAGAADWLEKRAAKQARAAASLPKPKRAPAAPAAPMSRTNAALPKLGLGRRP